MIDDNILNLPAQNRAGASLPLTSSVLGRETEQNVCLSIPRKLLIQDYSLQKNGRWWSTALDNLIFTSQRRAFPYFHENWLCLILETKYCSFIAEEVTARENKSFAREPESESWSPEVSFSALIPRLLFHSQLCIKVHSLLTPPKSLSIPLHFEPPSWSFISVLIVLVEC